jgi:hypothetical protein
VSVVEDANLPLRILLDPIPAERGIDGHRDPAREQDADEGVEEGRLRSQHQGDAIAGRHAALAQRPRHLNGALPERAIGDRLIMLPGEHDMHALGVGPHMPLQHLEERRRRRGGGLGRRQSRVRGHRHFGASGRSRDHCRDEIARTCGLLHDPIGEADPELLLDAQQQLDPLEAADPEVAIERVVEPDRAARRRAAELVDEPADDVEHALLGAADGSHGYRARASRRPRTRDISGATVPVRS